MGCFGVNRVCALFVCLINRYIGVDCNGPPSAVRLPKPRGMGISQTGALPQPQLSVCFSHSLGLTRQQPYPSPPLALL